MRRPLHPPATSITVPEVLAALGDPVRLHIVGVLSDGAEHLGPDFSAPVTQSTLSYHMRRLREAGIILSRPQGTRCYNSLRPELEERFPGLLHAVLAAAGAGTSNPSTNSPGGGPALGSGGG